MADYIIHTDKDGDGTFTRKLKLQLIGDMNLKQSKPVTSMPIPGQPAESSIHMALEGEKKPITLSFLLMDTGMDISDGTVVTSGAYGDNIKLGDVSSVDTTSEVVSISGDYTDRLSSGNDIAIRNSTGNDGVYTISSVSYDSGNNETDITVSGDITDATADGMVLYTIKTIQEQIAWIKEHIHLPNIGVKWKITGPVFNDTSISIEDCNITLRSDQPMTAEADLSIKVGDTV